MYISKEKFIIMTSDLFQIINFTISPKIISIACIKYMKHIRVPCNVHEQFQLVSLSIAIYTCILTTCPIHLLLKHFYTQTVQLLCLYRFFVIVSF